MTYIVSGEVLSSTHSLTSPDLHTTDFICLQITIMN